MSLNPIRPTLRTIHNGTRDVAKASIVIPAGDDLTVSEYVADQLQRDGAFKDGAAPEALLVSLAAARDAEAETQPTEADAGPTVRVKKAPAKKAAAKKRS